MELFNAGSPGWFFRENGQARYIPLRSSALGVTEEALLAHEDLRPTAESVLFTFTDGYMEGSRAFKRLIQRVDQLPPGRAAVLGQREQCRGHRARRMDDGLQVGVVEVEGVRADAVDEGRAGDVDAFPTAVAPVPSEGSFATATAMVVALCVILSDTFAFRAYGRVESVVPTGVLFLFTAALGTDRNLVAVTVLWVATAILTVAVLRFEQHDGDLAWMGARSIALLATLPAIIVTAGVSAVAAGAVAPRLPGAGESARAR